MSGTVLVTGGAGYLGSVLTRSLLDDGRPVVVLDDFGYGDDGLAPVRDHALLRTVRADVRDAAAVRAALAGVESVVHLAALANDPSGDLDPALTRSVNLDAYRPLLEACRDAGVRRFVNASSFSVYGVNVRPNITEDDPLDCRRPYSRCKADSEPIVRSFDDGRMTTVNLRLATLCGWSGRMRFDLIANLLVGEARARRRIEVAGGEQQRPQVHVADVCDLVALLLEASPSVIGGEVFNVGGENSSVADLARRAAEVVGADGQGPVDVVFGPIRDDERSYVVSSAKLFDALGFRASRSVASAMADVDDAHRRGEWTDHTESRYHNVRHLTARLGTGRLQDVR